MNAPFTAECPHCFSTFNLKSRASAGKKVKCKNCGESFTVKLIGETGDEFDDVEDYGSEMPAAASLPPARSSSSTSRKKKRRKQGASVPWKPIVIALVVVTVGVVGWIGYQALPSGGLMTMLDSPESVLDDYYEAQFDWVDAMASVNSNEDLERLKRASDAYRNRIWELNRRMILLGPVSEEREEEVRKYADELEERHSATLRERSQAEAERLQGLSLDRRQLYAAFRSSEFVPFSTGFAFPTPEPRDGHPSDQFHYELDGLYRDLAKLLVQIDGSSDATSRLDEINEFTDRFDQLRNHEHRNRSSLGTRYGNRSTMWTITYAEWRIHHKDWLGQDKTVEKAIQDLFYTVNKVDKARLVVTGAGEGGSENTSHEPGSLSIEEEKRVGKYQLLAIAMHNYHDAHRRFPGIDRDVEGHVGLSWRVHLLPFIDKGSLHQQFDLNSDWQAAQNQKHVNSRPDFYMTPYVDMQSQSSLHVFEGPGTPFDSGDLVRFGDISDGTTNTIMIFEGGRGTGQIWTKPGGIRFDPDHPKQNLGQVDGDKYLAIMFDGSVKAVSRNIDNDVLNAMIRHRDGAKPPQASANVGDGNSAAKPTKESNLADGTRPRLKQLGEAMLEFHEKYQQFPSDSNGLSWRVHLLQHLDPELYSQFDLDSSFTSPQNARLMKQCPEIFKSQYDTDPGKSGFNIFRGGPFTTTDPTRLQDITDGASNTVMIIEGGAGTERPWTQPGGIRIAPAPPQRLLGKIDGDDYFALMFDGSVKRIPKTMDRIEFLKMATRSQDVKINRR